MRLSNVERGDGLGPRLLFGLIRLVSGYRAPDVVRTLKYHPAVFGARRSRHTHAVMRGPSDWTVRASASSSLAFVSRLNHACLFLNTSTRRGSKRRTRSGATQ